jgi:hypothetical protein
MPEMFCLTGFSATTCRRRGDDSAMTIHGPDTLRARNLRLRAARVITTMSRGAFLYLTHTNRGARYTLSNGVRIAPEIARLIVHDPRVCSVDDGLFTATPQTWKYDGRLPHHACNQRALYQLQHTTRTGGTHGR